MTTILRFFWSLILLIAWPVKAIYCAFDLIFKENHHAKFFIYCSLSGVFAIVLSLQQIHILHLHDETYWITPHFFISVAVIIYLIGFVATHHGINVLRLDNIIPESFIGFPDIYDSLLYFVSAWQESKRYGEQAELGLNTKTASIAAFKASILWVCSWIGGISFVSLTATIIFMVRSGNSDGLRLAQWVGGVLYLAAGIFQFWLKQPPSTKKVDQGSIH